MPRPSIHEAFGLFDAEPASTPTPYDKPRRKPRRAAAIRSHQPTHTGDLETAQAIEELTGAVRLFGADDPASDT